MNQLIYSVWFALLFPIGLCTRNRRYGFDDPEEAVRTGDQFPPVVHHRRLVKDLLQTRGYDARVRPVIHHRTPVNVTIRMNLYQIVDVDERRQQIVLYTWMTQSWEDEFLAWNPSEYGEIDNIVVPYQSVWLPDTYLYNGLEMVRENAERWISVILEMNKTSPSTRARVVFRHPSLYKFTCNMDILYFPFDKQCCSKKKLILILLNGDNSVGFLEMIFGSWMYDAMGIDYFALQRNIFQEDFTESEEWTVLSFQSKHTQEKYSCCEIPFSHIYAYLLIQRKPLHFLVNLVIPTLIITLISFVGFFTPASTSGQRTEKVNLGITTLLAMSILLLMVSDQMPTTSNFVPLIGWFYLSIILLISLATVMTSIIINVQKQGHFGRRVSPDIKRLFFYNAGRFLFMTPPPNIQDVALIVDRPTEESLIPLTRSASDYGVNKQSFSSSGLVEDRGVLPTSLDNVAVGFSNQTATIRGGQAKKRASVPVNTPNLGFTLTTFNDVSCHGNGDGNLNRQLKTIQRQLLQLTEYVRAKEDEERIHAEWEWLAAILDRMLLIIFVSIVASVTLIILLVAPFGQIGVSPPGFCRRIDTALSNKAILGITEHMMRSCGLFSKSSQPVILLVVTWIQTVSVESSPDDLHAEPITYHSRLVKHLMRPGEYDARVRPIRGSFVPVNVTVRINLYQVIEVNEYSQFVRIYVWMTQSWEDEFLTWKPKNYNGLDTVVLPYQDVWLPDTYLYNSLQMKQDEVERLTSVIVSMANASTDRMSALVTLRYPAMYSFTCNMDIYYFPFDHQSCTLTFGSWTYDSTGIDYFPVQDEVFREDFIESEEWTVTMAKIERRLEPFICCPNKFSLLLMRLSLKRKPLFYIVNLILPALVITFVAFVGFFCPDNSTGERKEKVNLGIGTLLAMSVLLLTTSNQMPTTSK